MTSFLTVTQMLLLNASFAPSVCRIHTALLETLLILLPLILYDSRPKTLTSDSKVQDSRDVISQEPIQKNLPLYFINSQLPIRVTEMHQFPRTPFLFSFIGLMSYLYQSEGAGDGTPPTEIPSG